MALHDRDLPGTVGVRLLETRDDDFWDKSRYVLRTGIPVAESDIGEDDGLRRILTPLTRSWRAVGGSMLGMPLYAHGRPCGTLVAVRSVARKPFDHADWSTLQEIVAELTRIVTRPSSRPPSALQGAELPGIQVGTVDHASASGGRSFPVMFSAAFASWFAVVSPASADPDLAGLVRHALPVLARVHEDPAAVLDALNSLLLGQADHGGLLTVVLGRYVPDRRVPTLRLASAGHSPAVLVDTDGSVSLATGGGMPLGLFGDAQPVSQDVPLPPKAARS